MEFIAHRINTIDELNKLPSEFGVELDLRDNLEGEIYISHNPFEQGENFEKYLKAYHHGLMILNIKSERIEYEVKRLLDKYCVISYFFLDSSFPMIKTLYETGERKIALRYSEYEGMDTLSAMAGKVDWVWVDCFTKIPLDKLTYNLIKSLGYKMCFVSPELQGQPEKLSSYIEEINSQGFMFDAICTKSYQIDTWKSGLGKGK